MTAMSPWPVCAALALIPAMILMSLPADAAARMDRAAALAARLGDELRRVGEEDALMVFSYVPYTKDAVRAVNFASSRGAQVVSVTDSKVAPVVVRPGACLITTNASASLFPSVLPALAVAQLLASLMVSLGDEELLSLVERSQKQLNSFDVYVDRLD